MAINETVVIDRPPQDVFADVSDLARHPEWQNKLLDATVEGEGPIRVGTRVKQRRRVDGGTRTFTLEITEHDPPNRLAFRGIAGPMRPQRTISLEPLEDGQRTRYAAELDFEGHGLGSFSPRLYVETRIVTFPKSLEQLKRRLEAS